MRIGQVNQDNYKAYLELLGVKNPKGLKSLDNLEEKRTEFLNRDYSHEAQEARAVAAGLIAEGMLIKEGDESWKKIVDVPDSIKQSVKDFSRQTFIANGNGTMTAAQGDKLNEIIWGYVKTLPPSERLSAYWTLEKTFDAEAGRINNYIKSQVPGWATTQSFDTNILTKSNYGLGFDVKA